MKGYEVVDNVIVVNRELNELDIFLRDFLDVLKKYSDYLVVSGFVSISTGRTRGTEDIDVLFKVLDKEKFEKLFNDLIGNGFWCYQGDSVDEVYSYVKELESIRFSKKNQLFPNIEFIPIDESKKLKYFEFVRGRKLRVEDFEFKIPPLEFEILYKEIVLAGDKDLADAKHLRKFFSDILSEEKFKEYGDFIRKEKDEKRN
jgi:hypothetical protein